MKDFKMNKFSFLRFGFFLSWIAALVIVTSPLAMAEQSKKLNKEMMAAALKEMGVAENKDITMGEVWKKIRHKLPPSVRLQLDLSFQIYKDEKFPRIDLSEVKNSQGEAVVALNVNDGKDTVRVELAGKENNFMKFNGKTISEADVAGIEGFFAKIQDEQIIKKDHQRYAEGLKKQPTFPTYEMWKKMSPYERAHFMVQVRLMMREVDNVLAIHENTKKPIKSSQLEKDYELYLKLIFGQDAEAVEGEKPKVDKGNVKGLTREKVGKKEKSTLGADNTVPGSTAPKKKSQPVKKNTAHKPDKVEKKSSPVEKYERQIAVGKGCIVGGYPYGKIVAGKTTGAAICSLSEGGKLDDRFVNGCSRQGKTPQISCNPVLYGYDRTPGGKSGPICLDYDINNRETQVATTVNGICEKKSPLGENNPKNTYDMIYSILHKEKGMELDEYSQLFKISKDGKKVEVDEKAYNDLMMGEHGIFKKFDEEKNLADDVCGEIKKNPSAYELNSPNGQQTKACAALLKRTINLQTALATVVTAPSPAVEDPCPPTAPEVVYTGPVQERPVVHTAPIQTVPVRTVVPTETALPQCCSQRDTCKKPIVAAAVVDCGGASACEGEGVVVAEKEKEEKKSSGLPLWAKIGLFGAAIGSAVVFGLWRSGYWDRKNNKAKSVPPYVPPQSTTIPTSTPAPTPPAPIEGSGGAFSPGAGGIR